MSKYLEDEQCNALIALFNAQKGAGQLLDGLNNVQPSFEIIPGTFPAIGVQAISVDPKTQGGGTKLVTNKFAIVIGTDSQPADLGGGNTKNPSLSDAMSALRPFKNGVIAILTDPGNFFLGQLANTKTEITGVQYDWRVQPGASNSGVIEAYAIITYEATSTIGSFT